jgi:hypothetical protein
LFARLAGPLAGPGTPGATAFGRLLVAIDGSTLEVPYSAANTGAFGSPPTGHGRGGYPQVRLVTMSGCGTRGLIAAGFGKAKGKGGGELTLALQIAAAGAPGPGTLVLADRVFCCYALVAALTEARADVLIRARSGNNLPVCQLLTDGSWLSVLPDPRAARLRSSRTCTRRRRGSALGPDTSPLPGITIRVIEFTLTVTAPDGTRRSEPYRLITSLLDPVQAPARQVAECYAQRWEADIGHRWYPSSAVCSWLRSLLAVGLRLRGVPAFADVVAGRPCPALAQFLHLLAAGGDDPVLGSRGAAGGDPAAVDPGVDRGGGHAQLGCEAGD